MVLRAGSIVVVNELTEEQKAALNKVQKPEPVPVPAPKEIPSETTAPPPPKPPARIPRGEVKVEEGTTTAVDVAMKSDNVTIVRATPEPEIVVTQEPEAATLSHHKAAASKKPAPAKRKLRPRK